MNSKELSANLNKSLNIIRTRFRNGKIDDAGKEIRVITEYILISFKKAAGIGNTEGTDIYVSVINSLSNLGFINDDEKGKLHHLKNISNMFQHSSLIDRSGSFKEKEELDKYRRDFQSCINFCEQEVNWAIQKYDEFSKKAKSNSANQVYTARPIPPAFSAEFSDLDRYLKDMEEKFDKKGENNPTGAGMVIRDIFETILSLLIRITNVQLDPNEVNEKGDKIAAISALARDGWINRFEEDNLHHLRTTANLFAHAAKIDIEGDYTDKKNLNEARKNIQTEYRICKDLVTWAQNRVSAITSRNFRQGDSIRMLNARANKRLKRTINDDTRPWFLKGAFNYILPFVFSLSSTIGTAYFLRTSTFVPSVEKIFITDDYSVLSVKTHIIACVIMLLAFTLFYDITFPAAAGCLFFLLTRSATGSDLCAGLTASLVIIMTLRYPLGLKRIFGAITHGYWVLMSLILTTFMMISHFKATGQPIDSYSIGTRFLPIIIGYLMLYFIGTKVVNNLIDLKPFELAMENYNIPESKGIIPFIVVLVADILLFHKKWAKGLIFVTRNYYDSPVLFWTIVFIFIMICLYAFFIKLFSNSAKRK